MTTRINDIAEMMIAVRREAGSQAVSQLAREVVAFGFAVIDMIDGPHDAAETADRICTLYTDKVLRIPNKTRGV